jgi:hypothetical protein
MTASCYHRSGTLWYVSDGYIWDDLPATFRPESGRPLECSSYLHVFNPQSEQAQVTARFYHVDRSPTFITFLVNPGAIHSVDLATLPEVPHKQSFWIVVESSVPVLPQARHEDYTYWDPVPDALVGVAPYPGPLENETVWIYPDCYQGGPKSWYEQETLTILNPGSETVTARVRYLLRSHELGGEEEIQIPSERVVELRVWERKPILLGHKHGPPIQITGDYAVHIDASGPIVTQTTRRARRRGQSSVIGTRSTMAFPFGEGKHNLWYYPGGAIVDRGILPRDQNCDVTWNLLFTHNPNEHKAARPSVSFNYQNGEATHSEPLMVPPLKSDLEWMHLEPWLDKHTPINAPWAMTVHSDIPVVPEVTCAEFEMWSDVAPGAMSAVNFYPGPLEDERTWWLGIAPAGGSDDRSIEWLQSYHLFNPGEQPVQVMLMFLCAHETLTYEVTLSSGAVARVESTEIPGLPLHEPIAVCATSDAPFCAQLFVRAFTRGLPHTRSMYSQMGLPMALRG